MTPKAPPAGRSYTLKAQILKGSKKVIGRYKNTRTCLLYTSRCV